MADARAIGVTNLQRGGRQRDDAVGNYFGRTPDIGDFVSARLGGIVKRNARRGNLAHAPLRGGEGVRPGIRAGAEAQAVERMRTESEISGGWAQRRVGVGGFKFQKLLAVAALVAVVQRPG